MNKKYISIGVVAALIVMFFWNNRTDYYGEYSADGQPRYSIKLMDNDQAKLNINDQIYTVNYKEKHGRLEVAQDDVYHIYNQGVTEVYFEPKKDNTLKYTVVMSGKETDLATYKKIEGSNGDSGQPNVFWMTVKNMFYGLLICGVMMVIIWGAFGYFQKKNENQ
ncbi:hypothetical protein COL36_10395 [Bacillus wiedmannii]|uniref:hypothetical protein n=1 Tax=Bacillus wiedmannii TaxID=1890302 RepID=UPI000BF5ED39|nr:hypothetical protein [Bacillus wiedmannii]PFX61610.1 hypothetical protein COL36_10395 [Bacillus wiedmannii]